MRALRLALVAAIALSLPACGGEGEWVPTPSAELKVGGDVTAADPLPAGCPSRSGTSWNDKPIWKVADLPTPSTVTITDGLAPGDAVTVDRGCVTPYALRK